MKIKAIRKDKTAVKLENDKWYEVSDEVKNFLEKGKDVKLENNKVVFVFDNEKQKQDRDMRITKLALLNTATEIIKHCEKTNNLDIDKLSELVILTAERLEKWVLEK